MKSIYNFILENIFLPIGDLINGSTVYKELKRWRKICTLSENEIEELSKTNLRNLLNFAVKKIPHYKQLNPVYHDDPYVWIKQFPVMRKSDIRENLDQLLSVPKEKLKKFSSSGSSGIQSTTYQSEKELSANRAMQMLWWEWAGYYPGKKLIQTGINPNRGWLKSLKDFLFRTRYIQAFSHDENDIIKLLKSLEGKKGYQFGGYASSLNVFANIALRNNIQNVQFDAAISWGDKLFDHYKTNIFKAFKCKTFETYGCSEGFLVAAKKDLEYYYIMSPHVFIEIVDDDGKDVPDGAMGHILLTRLDNYSMPLIRYYIGDMASILPKKMYPLHRDFNFPLLKEIYGRNTDIIKTASGKFMVVHSFTGIFEHIPEIKQFKVIQKNLNSIEIEYIEGENFDDSVLVKVEKKIQEYLNETFPVYWKKVKEISPSPSGKPKMVESLINNL